MVFPMATFFSMNFFVIPKYISLIFAMNISAILQNNEFELILSIMKKKPLEKFVNFDQLSPL